MDFGSNSFTADWLEEDEESAFRTRYLIKYHDTGCTTTDTLQRPFVVFKPTDSSSSLPSSSSSLAESSKSVMPYIFIESLDTNDNLTLLEEADLPMAINNNMALVSQSEFAEFRRWKQQQQQQFVGGCGVGRNDFETLGNKLLGLWRVKITLS